MDEIRPVDNDKMLAKWRYIVTRHQPTEDRLCRMCHTEAPCALATIALAKLAEEQLLDEEEFRNDPLVRLAAEVMDPRGSDASVEDLLRRAEVRRAWELGR